MALKVRHTLTNTELVDIFMGMLHSLYYEKMVRSSSSNFADIVIIEERIENGMKTGKIDCGGNQQSAGRRPPSGYTKMKEGETNVVRTSVPQYQASLAPMKYLPYPYVATT